MDSVTTCLAHASVRKLTPVKLHFCDTGVNFVSYDLFSFLLNSAIFLLCSYFLVRDGSNPRSINDVLGLQHRTACNLSILSCHEKLKPFFCLK